MSHSSDPIPRYLANRRKEIDGAALYEALAAGESQPQLAEVFRQLAAGERRHAALWEHKLRQAGVTPPPPRPSWRARVMIQLARHLGTQFVLPTVAAGERLDSKDYDQQSDAVAAGLSRDERSHARVLRLAARAQGGLSGGSLARLEGRHRGGDGNALRAAVLGANDGLVSILSLVMGLAGANLPNRDILIAGLAGLMAGAGSMALGEWLSVQSARELYQGQIQIEAEELAANPAEEQMELALIYQAKGLPKDQAQQLAAHLMADQAHILDTLAREELGIDPDELGGSAYTAALASFALFVTGAVFPLAPFLFWGGSSAILLALLTSTGGLFAIGAAISLMTGRGLLYSGLRQVLVGGAAAALTFGLGRMIGVSLG